jgi:hypothetical protein
VRSRLEQARHLIANGRPDAAVRWLRRYLSSWNPYLAVSSLALEDAAGTYVRLTSSDPAELGTIGWAVHLHRASRCLHGATSEPARTASRMLTDLAQRRGRSRTAVLRDPLTYVSETRTPTECRFAVVRLLHQVGLCDSASREAAAAVYRHAQHQHEVSGLGAYLIEAVTMLERCGRAVGARALLTAYSELLPAVGTEECERLVAQAVHTLGVREEVAYHQAVCGFRNGTRRSRLDVRAVALGLLKGL